MKATKISKIIHWLAIFSFLLPFFYTGCEKKESGSKQIQNQDSIQQVESLRDSVKSVELDSSKTVPALKDSLKPDSGVAASQTSTSDSGRNGTNLDHLWSELIAEQIPILKPLLVSKEDTYSGLAMVIDSIRVIPYFSTLFAFVFLILGLVSKYQGCKKIWILNFAALVFIGLAMPLSESFDRLYGYWVALGLIFALNTFDFIFSGRRNSHLT